MGIVACINRNKWSRGGAQKKWKGTHNLKYLILLILWFPDTSLSVPWMC